ncbi:unnamed protein product [Hapterophycus canaliculatus]
MKKALFLVSSGAGLLLSQARGIRREGDVISTRRSSETSTRLQELYFSEILTEDDSVTVLETGGFKLTASCKTITHTYEDLGLFSSMSYGYVPPSSASTSSGFSARRDPTVASPCELDDNGGRSRSSGNPSSHASSDDPRRQPPSDGYSSGSRGDPCRTGPWRGPRNGADGSGYMPFGSSAAGRGPPWRWNGAGETDPCEKPSSSDAGTDSSYRSDVQDGGEYGDYGDYYSGIGSNFTESFATLELTYTPPFDDYLYGFPSYQSYPDDDVVAGTYSAGESRTQIVFAGSGGFPGETCTFQSMSGRFISVSGDRTIGIHRSFADRTGSMWASGSMGSPEEEAEDSGFPDGVECMVAGVITYVGDVDRPIKTM